MVGVQARWSMLRLSTRSIKDRKDSIEPVSNPQTEASAINIGSPVSWMKALSAIYDSHGLADAVSDEEIFSAQKLLASKEGLFVEPASATPIAYLARIASVRSDQFDKMRDAIIVCICTGNGLKDPERPAKGYQTRSNSNNFRRCKDTGESSCMSSI